MDHNHLPGKVPPEGVGCPACDAYHQSQREGARATPLPRQTMESYLAWLENTPLDQLPPGEAPGQREGAPSIEDLIEASSLGTPHAKAMRAAGRRIRERVVDRRLTRIEDDFTASRIDEREAYERCLEAGCTQLGARLHVARWAGSGG